MGMGLGNCCCNHCGETTAWETVRSNCIDFEFHWCRLTWHIEGSPQTTGDCPTSGSGDYLLVYDGTEGPWNFIRTGRADGIEIKARFEDVAVLDTHRTTIRLTRVEFDDTGQKFIATWNATESYWEFDGDEVCKRICIFASTPTLNVSAYIFESSDLATKSFTVTGVDWDGASGSLCCEGFNGSKVLAFSDGSLGYTATIFDDRVVAFSINTASGYQETYPRGGSCTSALNYRYYGIRSQTFDLGSLTPSCTGGATVGYEGDVAQTDSRVGAPVINAFTPIDEMAGGYLTFYPQSLTHQNTATSGGDPPCPSIGTIDVA